MRVPPPSPVLSAAVAAEEAAYAAAEAAFETRCGLSRAEFEATTVCGRLALVACGEDLDALPLKLAAAEREEASAAAAAAAASRRVAFLAG